MTHKIVYKIKHDNLFSSGGTCPTFGIKGKTWSTRGAVSNHLAQFSEKRLKEYYEDCEIAVYEFIETEVDSVNVSDWTLSKSTIRAKELEEIRRTERELKQTADRKLYLEKELAKLK